MGVFHVNMESYNSAAVLSKQVWEIFITLGFFLIWLDYSKEINRVRKYALQGSGLVILVIMALLYQGGSSEHPVWMKFHWWGILGLIGWAYLVGSFVFLAFRDKVVAHLLIFACFVFLNSAGELGSPSTIASVMPHFLCIVDGAISAPCVPSIVAMLVLL